jgi:hypothetical protein
MTRTLALSAQTWFTYIMKQMSLSPKTRETTTEKAERLIREGRYEMDAKSNPSAYWVGTIFGDHGVYQAISISQEYMDRHGIAGGRVACNCKAGKVRRSNKACSHALAADMLREEWE